MNYRHAYHAGNFADIFKHLALMLLIEHLHRKPGPVCILDTHAGIGLYDLTAAAAGKTGEWRGGIGRLWHAADLPAPLARLVGLIRAVNPGRGAAADPVRYPGSPCLARALLRPADRLVVCELHPDDGETLRRRFAGDPQVAVHHQDGYLALKAFLPPRERRGLVLIDPPYESRDEIERLAKALRNAQRRWPTGVYALWYPIKDRPTVWRLQEAVAACGLRKILVADLIIRTEQDPTRLNGCGLLFVNPPWQFDQALQAILPGLHALVSEDGGGGTAVTWITTETAPP